MTPGHNSHDPPHGHSVNRDDERVMMDRQLPRRRSNLRKLSYLLLPPLLLALAQPAGCIEHKVGDKSTSDVFAEDGMRRLAEAACKGDETGVRSAVQRGANPNGGGLRGLTPLVWAVSCDSVAGVKALLAAGANPNQSIGKEFTSVVYVAARRFDPGPLKALLDAGAEANVFDLTSDRTGISQALLHGIDTDDWRHWELMLPKIDINQPYDRFGETIALRAARLGQHQRVVQLLEMGYSYRPHELARSLEVAANLTENAAHWQRKAMELLKVRGVVFPIGPTKVELISEAELQRLPPNRR